MKKFFLIATERIQPEFMTHPYIIKMGTSLNDSTNVSVEAV